MKKFLILLTFLFSFLTVKSEITNLQTSVNGTNVEFYWQGDTTLSKVYEVGILESEEWNYICYVGAYSKTFVVGEGWFGFSTDLTLKYGRNWVDYQGTSTEELFPKLDWDASVDSLSTGLTLKPGTYVVYAEGYDINYKTVTEDYEFDIITIEDTATEIDNIEVKKATKVLTPNGKLFIVTGNGKYNVLGIKID